LVIQIGQTDDTNLTFYLKKVAAIVESCNNFSGFVNVFALTSTNFTITSTLQFNNKSITSPARPEPAMD